MDDENCFVKMIYKRGMNEAKKTRGKERKVHPKEIFSNKDSVLRFYTYAWNPYFLEEPLHRALALLRHIRGAQAEDSVWISSSVLFLLPAPQIICSLVILLFPNLANKHCSCVNDWKVGRRPKQSRTNDRAFTFQQIHEALDSKEDVA